MFDFLSSAPLSADDFARRVFEFLAKRIDEPLPNIGDVKNITLRIATHPEELPETERARLYLLCERYLIEDKPSRRTPKETLRADIYIHCHAAHVDGGFALLFWPATDRLCHLAEHYAELVAESSRELLGLEKFEDLVKTVTARVEPDDGIHFDWLAFEKGHSHAKDGTDGALEALRGFLNAMHAALAEENGPLRAEIVMKTAYDRYLREFGFLEDAPQVLTIIPEGLLAEERIVILPKTQLAEQLVSHSRDLDLATSELRDEKRKLATALDDLKRADEAKTDFITVVSHHFRTPLSAIRWTTEVLLDALSSEKQTEGTAKTIEGLRAIEEKGHYLIGTLEDIFDLLAIDSHTLTLSKKPDHLWEIASDVVKEFAPEAGRRGVQLVFEHGVAPKAALSIDREKIRRVFVVLLTNALRYTPAGGAINVHVADTTLGDQPALGATIEDTGIGFMPGDSLKLFTKFYRGANAIKVVPEGVGLGLYLAKHIVEAHGGRIEATPRGNGGAILRFALPRSDQ